MMDPIELFNNLKSNQNLTVSDIDHFNMRFQLEQIQMQELKDSGWRFDKIIDNIFL